MRVIDRICSQHIFIHHLRIGATDAIDGIIYNYLKRISLLQLHIRIL